MSEDTFLKILDNTASETEKRDFFSSCEETPEKRAELYRHKNLYVLSHLNPDAYRKEQHQSFRKFWKEAHPNKSIKIISPWIKYAAIFIMASLLGFMADYIISSDQKHKFISQNLEYSSEKGSVSTIHLEDGSAIWLSSGTKLRINQNQHGETIAQLNGEAYFDLIPNPNRKFIVDLGTFKIKDIGTRFNVRAYSTEKSIMTSLVEGQIDLINNSGKTFLKVKPGEFIGFDRSNNKISIFQQDPSIVSAWKDGKFVFINQTLSDICKELENWYNVEIQIEDQKLANTRYTSVVKRTTTVQMVLKILAITDQIKYEIIDKKEGKDFIRIKK